MLRIFIHIVYVILFTRFIIIINKTIIKKNQIRYLLYPIFFFIFSPFYRIQLLNIVGEEFIKVGRHSMYILLLLTIIEYIGSKKYKFKHYFFYFVLISLIFYILFLRNDIVIENIGNGIVKILEYTFKWIFYILTFLIIIFLGKLFCKMTKKIFYIMERNKKIKEVIAIYSYECDRNKMLDSIKRHLDNELFQVRLCETILNILLPESDKIMGRDYIYTKIISGEYENKIIIRSRDKEQVWSHINLQTWEEYKRWIRIYLSYK